MKGPGDSIMHAELKIGDSVFMLADEMPNMDVKEPQSVRAALRSVSTSTPKRRCGMEARRRRRGRRVMPLTDMFWGDRVGAARVDPFGHRWSLAQHTRDLSPQEIEQGQKAFMAQVKK